MQLPPFMYLCGLGLWLWVISMSMLPSGTICKMCNGIANGIIQGGADNNPGGYGKKGTSILEGVFRVAGGGGIIIGVGGRLEAAPNIVEDSHSKMITVTLLSLALAGP